jgi:hypothetical protein
MAVAAGLVRVGVLPRLRGGHWPALLRRARFYPRVAEDGTSDTASGSRPGICRRGRVGR